MHLSRLRGRSLREARQVGLSQREDFTRGDTPALPRKAGEGAQRHCGCPTQSKLVARQPQNPDRVFDHRRHGLSTIIPKLFLVCSARGIAAVISVGYRAALKQQKIGEDIMMRHRSCLVGAAMALFPRSPARPRWRHRAPICKCCSCSTPRSLQPRTTRQGFSSSPANPPTTFTGLPTFCRVTATLTPDERFQHQDRGLAAQDDVERPLPRHRRRRLPGHDLLQRARPRHPGQGFAATNSDLGTGSSGCTPLFCGSGGDSANPLGDRIRRSAHRRPSACSDIPSGSRISAIGRST